MVKPDFIVSDLHLGAVPRETERAFVHFLRHVGREAGTLLLAGDLFDFWFEYGDVVPGRHFRVLAALAELVEAGVPVTLLGGNHDAWGGRFLEEEVGLSFHPGGRLRTTLAGRPALVAHGDGLGRGDLGYRVLKAVIRSWPAVAAFRALPPQLGMRLAGGVSRTEERRDRHPPLEERSRLLQEWARETLAAEPALAYVVCGHTHIPLVLEVAPGRYYVNSGDWLRNFTYATFSAEDGAPRLLHWRAHAARG